MLKSLHQVHFSWQKSDLPLQFASFYLGFNVALGSQRCGQQALVNLFLLSQIIVRQNVNTFPCQPMGIPPFLFFPFFFSFEVFLPNGKISEA